MSLREAVNRHVQTGARLSIGGFTLSRNPMAAVHEIIRQGITDLHVYAHSNGQGLDELIGAGAVSRLEIAYSGNGRYAPTCLNFKRSCIDSTLAVEDYTNFQMALRFLAGAMGVPFLPTASSLGTDIVNKWGFDPGLREKDSSLSLKKLVVMENPFSRSDTPEKLVLVPAIHPDVTLIHAQVADTSGTTRIKGLTFSDIEQAKASKSVIVTCDTLVEKGRLNIDPQANQLPSFCVDAVVKVPFGAYPTACFGLYDYDGTFLDQYKTFAASQESFDRYVTSFIRGTRDHAQFVEKACGERMEVIRANPEKGYSERIKR